MQRKEKIESAVPATWSLRRGDCLDVLADVETSSIDLVYLDPPFNSGLRRQGRKGLTFDDRFVDVAAYRDFIGPRLVQAHRVLRSTGLNSAAATSFSYIPSTPPVRSVLM